MIRARQVVRLLLNEVDAVIDVDDAALDFIETQVGRFQFPTNWRRDRARYLGLLKKVPHGDEIVAEIDRLATDGVRWSDVDDDEVIDLKD